ncbi:hypothetical protein DMH18_06610 [Streptomyces sp. WAC 06783]|nr:hypothetical protein DMH18_06610 [Streptomyces sp. WAC 06783]
MGRLLCVALQRQGCLMNQHRGTLDPPVHLLDPFAGDINPVPRDGCARCAAEAARRDAARDAGHLFVAVDASNEIRRHPRHRVVQGDVSGAGVGHGPVQRRRGENVVAWWLMKDGNPQDDSDSGNKHGGGGSDEGGNTNDGQDPAEGR